MRAIGLSDDLISTARCTAAVGSGFAGPPCMPQPTKPGSDEGGAAGEHGGMALPRHDAVNERMCRRATVAYGLLMLQKQYSSRSPLARKCSLSTMWL